MPQAFNQELIEREAFELHRKNNEGREAAESAGRVPGGSVDAGDNVSKAAPDREEVMGRGLLEVVNEPNVFALRNKARLYG